MESGPDFSDDIPIFDLLGIADPQLIGFGGEARVYALDGQRVLRISHPEYDMATAKNNFELVQWILAKAKMVGLSTPEVISLDIVGERIVRIEKRLPGRPLSDLLANTGAEERAALINELLDAAEKICRIAMVQTQFGDVSATHPVRAQGWEGYLVAKIAQTLGKAPAAFQVLDPEQIAAHVPKFDGQPRLVHFDLFPGNVLFHTERVSAIIDFGPTMMMGDKRMELWSAVAYLDSQISPHANAADRAAGEKWLEKHNLQDGYAAAKQWIAAYWTFAHDDPKVLDWCRQVLLEA